MINSTKDLPLVERVIIQIFDDYFDKFNKRDAINFIESNIPTKKLEEYMEGITYD